MIDRASSSGPWRRDGEHGPRGPDCPDPGLLHAWLEGFAPERETRSIRKHLQECETCMQEVGLVTSFQQADADAVDDTDLEFVRDRYRETLEGLSPGRDRRWQRDLKWISGIGVAAAVLAFFLVPAGVRWMGMESGQPPVNGGDAYRGDRVELLAPLGELRTSPEEFRWHSTPSEEVRKQRVVLRDVADVTLWSADCGAEDQVVAIENSPVRSDTRYRWHVESIRPDGSVASQSLTGSFVWRAATEESPANQR